MSTNTIDLLHHISRNIVVYTVFFFQQSKIILVFSMVLMNYSMEGMQMNLGT